MLPPPLNLSRTQDPRNGLIPFQLPIRLQRQSDGRPGPPGLRIPPRAEPAHQTSIDASVGSPAVLPSRQSRSATLGQNRPRDPISSRTDGDSRSERPGLDPTSQRRPQHATNDSSSSQQRPQRQPSSRNRQYHTPSRDGALIHGCVRPSTSRAGLQSPRTRPRGPRPQGIWTPTSSYDKRAILDDRANQLAQLEPATSRKSNEIVVGGHASLGPSLERYVPYRPEGATRAHVVLIQEPDLVDLVARGVLDVRPESNLPPCLLRVGSDSLVREPSKDGGVKILQNSERKPVAMEESPESVRRHSSCKAQVEEVVFSRRGPSGDSGYCTLSSDVPHSASMPKLSGTNPALWMARAAHEPVGVSLRGSNIYPSPEREPDSWSARGPAEHKALRRRSSAPSLRGRFRMFLED